LNSIGVIVGVLGLLVSLREVFMGTDAAPSVGPQNANPENLVRWVILVACVSFVLAALGGYVYRNKKILGALVIVGLAIPAGFINSYLTYKILGGFPLVAAPGTPTRTGEVETVYRLVGMDLEMIAGIVAFAYILAVIYINIESVGKLFLPKMFDIEVHAEGLVYGYYFMLVVIAPLAGAAAISAGICFSVVLGLIAPQGVSAAPP
jgi:hypothetical protein